MKNKLCVIFVSTLVLSLLTCPAFASSTFPDVDEDSAYVEATEFLLDLGVMEGDDQGNFNPNKFVTRAEMAAIICRMLGEDFSEAKGGTTFTDVAESHWANAYITKVAELGIVEGDGNGIFGPSDVVTYEQAVTMLIRAIGCSDDANNAGGYPNGFIYVANENGYLEGISAKNGDQMMRWQVAILCHNIMIGGTGE